MKALKKKIMAVLMSVLTVITGLYAPVIAHAAPAEPTTGTLTKGDQLIYMGWGTNYFTVDYDNDDNTYSRNAYCIVPELSAPADGDYSLTAADQTMTKLVYYCAGAPGESQSELNPTSQGGEEDAFVNSHLMLSCYYCENVINDPNWTRGLTSEAVSNFEELVTRILALPAPPSNFKAYIIHGGSNQDIISWRMEEESKGYLVIYKKSGDSATTDGSDDYSLSGAVFKIYKYDETVSKHQGEYVGEYRTKNEGTYTDGSKYSKTDVIELETGDYTIEEVTAPRGFDINTDIIGDKIIVSDTTTAEVPLVYTVTEDIGEAWVYIQKVSSNPDITDGSAAYSLKGATYQIFKYDASNAGNHYAGALVATATTDESGKTEKVKLSAPADGTSVKFVIHENHAPESGFGVDSEWHVVELDSSNTADNPYCLTSTEPFLSAPALKFIKRDEEGNEHLSLAGAQFTVNYYDVGPDEMVDDTYEPDATWVVETVETTDDEGITIGYAELSSEYLVDGSSPLILTSDGNAVIPYGQISVEETKAPEGYVRTPSKVVIGDQIEIRDPETLSKPIFYTVSDSNGDGVPDFTFAGEMTDEYKAIHETPKYGGIAVQKIDPETREAVGYSYPQGFLTFEGATFNIINNNDGTIVNEDVMHCEKGEVAATITTDATGRAATSPTALPYGHYLVVETKAPVGYLVNPAPIPVEITEQGQIVEIEYEDEVIRGGFEIQKRDFDSKNDKPQGSYDFSGVTFEVISKNSPNPVLDSAGNEFRNNEVVYTFTTDENGYFKSSTDALAYGDYLIREIKAPKGYWLYGKLEATLSIREEGVIVDLTSFEKTISDRVKRGDLTFVKKDEDNVPMPHVAFMISKLSAKDGKTVLESHRAYTDGNGKLMTGNRDTVKHSTNTNANDNVADIEDGSWTNGIWFGDAPVDDTMGALPDGIYLIQEERCKGNEGYSLVSFVVTTNADMVAHLDYAPTPDTNNNFIVEAGTIHDTKDNKSDYVIRSLAYNTDLTDKAADLPCRSMMGAAGQNITDEVTWEFDNPDIEDYVLVSVIMDKETGKVFTDADGKTFKEVTRFNSKGHSHGIETVYFKGLNLTGMEGKHLVIFEYLYDAAFYDSEDAPTTLADDADFDNEKQTLYVSSIKTTARTDVTGDNVGAAVKELVITDKVSYTNLIPGYEYVLRGTLMDKATGKELTADGKPVTAEKRFNPTTPDGFVEMDFYIDASGLSGKSVVVFEDLYLKERLISYHRSLSDEGQTIRFPEIKTTASDVTTDDNVGNTLKETIEICDRVSFTNLIAGKEYTLRGTLIDKATGKPVVRKSGDGILDITAETKFIPTTSDGYVDMIFEVPANEIEGLQGLSVVVFESLFHNGAEVAVHADIEDEGQTVHFPEIGTTASSGIEENEHAAASVEEKVTIKDTVAYRNLVPGKEYVVKGTLVNKATGKEIGVTAEKKFVAKDSDGAIELEFVVDGKKLAGETVVAFESLYHNGIEVAVHADIEDEDQSIHFPEIGTTASSGIDENEHAASSIDEKVTITDTVAYKNLVIGKEYVVKGTLVDKATGKEFGVNSEKAFVAEEADGTIEIEFEVDGKALSGKTVVVFEDLFFKDVKLAVHADIEDDGQTIHFPEIGTTASSGIKDNEKVGTATAEKVKITDTVSYKNLVPGKEYVVKGSLVNKETGEEIGVTAEKKFTAEKPDGTVDIEFEVDGKALSGKTVVAFEDLYFKDVKLAIHADIEDEDQSIHFPEIKTKAAVDGKKKVVVSKSTKLIDTVEYRNLVPGKEYRLFGTLMSSDGSPVLDKDGKAVTKEIDFTPQSPDGTIDVEFIFDSTAFAGKSVVCFETLYFGGIEIATHSDLKDEGQTVTFEKPEKPERPSSPKTYDETTPLPTALFLAGAAVLTVLLLAMRKKKVRR